MSTLKQSWDRLRAERWCNNPSIASKSDATARFQKLADGSGSYVHDEYKVVIASMPPLLSAEAYLLELARSPNNATNHGLFNAVNRFTRRSTEAPGVGDIYDIDIMGPDNGSIVLVELSPGFGTHQSEGAWFDIQTISCEKYGSHPEAGTREFGFEYTKHGVASTPAVSRAPATSSSAWPGQGLR